MMHDIQEARESEGHIMGARITETDVLEKLRTVQDPDLRRDIVSLGFVKNVKICAPAVSFDIELTTPACPVKDRLKAEAEAAVRQLEGIEAVTANMTSNVRPGPVRAGSLLPAVKNSIAVASGKGGVGKSTAAANLAVALQQTGASVGLCDADVYGPSMPTMFGIQARPQGDAEQRLIPLEAHGVKLMSMGFLTTRDTPVIWRGPMATKLVQQFLGGVAWGELDYLVIDLPPGTGDVQLTLTQSVPLTGAVIITTPQNVARDIAQKGLRMFQQVQVPILGVIENMSYFVCPGCQQRTYIFRKGGGEEVAKEMGLPFLGAIPIDPEVAEGGDAGVPIVARNPDSPAARAYLEIARAMAAQVSIVNFETARGAAPREIVEEERQFRFRWSDGHESTYGFEYLRNHCPCAVCVDEWSGKRKSLTLLLPSNFRPLSVSPVGRYAVQINWSDGHGTGIYSFARLRELCPCADCQAA
jgi:ATP-binding protein involved in chromosome partitioning